MKIEEAVKVLEKYLFRLTEAWNKDGFIKEQQALTLAIETLKRIEVEKIEDLLVGMVHLGTCIYDKDDHENKEGAEIICNYLEAKG